MTTPLGESLTIGWDSPKFTMSRETTRVKPLMTAIRLTAED